MDYRKSRLLLWTGYLTCLVFLGVYWFTKITWLGVAGIAVLAAAYIQALLYLRCPHCGKPLSLHNWRPDYCPRCGQHLDWHSF